MNTCARSVPFVALEEGPVAYAHEPLFTDAAARAATLTRLVEVGR